MKLFVISDIHGSYKYALAALEAFKKSGADRLVILGDFYYHGPRNRLPDDYAPMKVAELLNPLKDRIIALRGNCDAEVDEYISSFRFLRSWVYKSAGKRILFYHGHYQRKNLSSFDAVVYGHTHIYLMERKDKTLFVNPGSISLPKAPSSQNYLIIDKGKISAYDLISHEKTGEETI